MKHQRIGIFVSLLLLTCVAAAQPKPAPATVIARTKPGKVTLEYNGQPLAGGTILAKLQKLHSSHNISRLDVLIAPELRLADIYELESSASKAGFSSYRLFVFDRQQKRMMPVQFGKEELFTLAPK